MKFKPTVLLTTFLVTMGLLLGASTAQAADVITDDDGNVTRIENLGVFDDASNITIFYNVDFVYDTAINVYPSGEYDFFPSENAVVALVAVNVALNAADPIPPGAGPQGSDQFFIGAIDSFGRVVAPGGQRFPDVWGGCEEGSESDCIVDTAILDPDEPFTYAKFTETQDVPPGKATLISPIGATFETNPTYTWNAVADATWYNLIVKDDTEEVIIDDWHTAAGAGCGDGTGECSVTPVDVLADGSYQWLIQTYNLNGEGPESDALDFTVDTTGAPPGPATLISPNGTITENIPKYTWDAVANATWYRLFVWDSTETTVIDQWYTADEAGCVDGTGECSVTPDTELADDSHEWWIRTWNNPGKNGPWSDALDFTVDTTGAPPGPATLISPNGTITENTPTYTWDAVADSTWYRLFVWDSTETTVIDQWYTADEAGCVDGTGECSVTPDTELADDSHEWWIRTWNKPGGNGEWSDGLSFTVDTSTGATVVETDEIGNVTRILNLQVIDETTEEVTIYNVRFVYGQANVVYGSDLNFPFTPPEDDETIFGALEAVTDVLNAEDPIPPGASSQGTDQFFIGYEEDGPVTAVGGENIAGAWDQCETNPCIGGVALLNAYSDLVTWADFDRVVAPGVVQVFRTSRTYRGNLDAFDPNGSGDGLAGADAICQELAEAAGLTGTWTAWLSDDNADAIDRIPDGQYQLVDGTVIADDKADLTDGFLKAPISLNEFGSPEEGYAWTGTQPDGTAMETNCSNWTNNSGSGGCTAGESSCGVTGINSTNPDWTRVSENGFNCNELLQLHCFGGGQ